MLALASCSPLFFERFIVTVMLPLVGVNFTAFVRRFRTTYWSRRLSNDSGMSALRVPVVLKRIVSFFS